YPHMTVAENMGFSLDLKGVPKADIKKRVQEAGQQLGIEQLLDRKPGQLSGGQRQRVALGRAIVRNPAVFLMDEPLSNLDAKLRVQARAELSRLHQKLGTTFVYVTHDQVEAMTMGTRIAVMNQGILQQIDTPQNVYEHPNNMFVAGFLGSPSMNFAPAQLVDKEGELVVQAAGLSLPVAPERQTRYRAYGSHKLVLGIRPEAIYQPAYAPPGIQGVTVTAKVTVVELMGHEVIVYCNLPDGTEFVARIDPRSKPEKGEQLELLLDASRLHLFDQDTEQTL
ncbi:MAG: ATP-binding cassette domain-containing protein, partial [Cyanobacteria bacterium J06632_22]